MDNLGYIHSNAEDAEPPPEYFGSFRETNGAPAASCSSSSSSSRVVASHEKPNGIPKVTGSANGGAAASHESDGVNSIVPGRCGIFCCKPQWMQRFPTRNWFIAVFLVAATIKGMSGSYYPATISSVEKRLKLSTETIGYVSSGNEVSQIFLSLILSYVGGRGHRPRWIALGVLSSAAAYMMYASTHFIYGSGNDALSYTEEYYDQFHNSSDTSNFTNATSLAKRQKEFSAVSVCKPLPDESAKELDCGYGDDSAIPLVLIFMAQFVAGVGSVLFYTLAGPYIDDHMPPVKAPLIIAATGAVRQTGPLVGYVIAFLCLRMYINPSLTPLITNKDDRWIGAWWLGWVIFAASMALVGCVMSLFPKVLRVSEKKRKHVPSDLELKSTNGSTRPVPESEQEVAQPEPIFQEDKKDLRFWASVKDLMFNKINLWNNLSILCFGFAFSGFSTYFPKYLETVLKQNASNAALTTGASSIIFQVAGLLTSGYLISRFQLRARTLQGVNVVVDIVIVLVLLSFTQLVCKQGTVVDTSMSNPLLLSQPNELYYNLSWSGTINATSHHNLPNNPSTKLHQSCSSDCNCARSQITPVCFEEKNLMFYSACHAGCKSYNATSQHFSDCSCLPSPDIMLTKGKCVNSDDCYSTFITLVSLMALVRFGTSFGRIGNVLIPYRCVDRSQKSLASGLSFLMWSIVSIPSPIMYGKIIDSTCILWGSKCGGQGSCLLYDDVKFAYAMSTTAAGLALLGMICDAMVWYYVKDLKLYGESEEERNAEKTGQ